MSNYFFIEHMFVLCYNRYATTPRQVQKGGVPIHGFYHIIFFSIIASIVAYYICKWLDGDDKR